MLIKISFTILLFFLCFPEAFSQDKLSKKQQDSICKLSKKMVEPKRVPIEFPSKQVTDEYKLNALKKAIPDSFCLEGHPKKWFYNYYFKEPVIDYDPLHDSLIYPSGDPLQFKLNNTYFFDINGDGLLDFIHYTTYFRALVLSHDSYEIFIQQKDGYYKWLQFSGFITDIKFNKDNSIKKISTYFGACCTNRENYFNEYQLDKKTNTLVLKKSTMVLTCQYGGSD